MRIRGSGLSATALRGGLSIAGFAWACCRCRAARKGGGLILVDKPTGDAGPRGRTAVYARVSSADEEADLDRQVARVTDMGTETYREARTRR